MVFPPSLQTQNNRTCLFLLSTRSVKFGQIQLKSVELSRFGHVHDDEMDKVIKKTTPKNTIKSNNSIWKHFMEFCSEKNYTFGRDTSASELASILKCWAFNMRKINGEPAVKVLWNVTAKLLMEKYFNEYNIKINPFHQIEFKVARDARDTKRKELQDMDGKRKESANF